MTAEPCWPLNGGFPVYNYAAQYSSFEVGSTTEKTNTYLQANASEGIYVSRRRSEESLSELAGVD